MTCLIKHGQRYLILSVLAVNILFICWQSLATITEGASAPQAKASAESTQLTVAQCTSALSLRVESLSEDDTAILKKIRELLPTTWHDTPAASLTREQREKFAAVIGVIEHPDLYELWALSLRKIVRERLHGQELTAMAITETRKAIIESLGPQLGFALDEAGELPILYSTRQQDFLQLVSQGMLFEDREAASLQSRIDGKIYFHRSLSHPEFLVFIAQHTPRFVSLYKSLAFGKAFHIWDLLFDDPESGSMTNPALFWHYTEKIIQLER